MYKGYEFQTSSHDCKAIGRHAVKAVLPACNEEGEWTVKDQVHEPTGF